MSRNGDLLTAVKKDAAFSGFFGQVAQSNIDMPNSIKYEYMETKDFIENLDDKVSYAKTINQEKLKNKVLVDLNRLNREERLVQKLEEKLAKQGIEVNESSMIKKDLDDLQSLQQFSDSLKNTSDTISNKIEAFQQKINELKEKINDQKNHLRQTNSIIMENSSRKESFVKALRKFKKHDNFLGTSSIVQNHLSGSLPFQSDLSTDDHYLTSVPEQMMLNSQFNNNSIISQQYPNMNFPQAQSSSMNHSNSQNNLKYKKLTNNNTRSVSNLRQHQLGTFQHDDEFEKQKGLHKSSSSQALPPLKFDPVSKMMTDIKKIKDINEEIKNYFLKKSNGFIELKRLITDCFSSQKKRVLKQHKISNSLGLADSMLFEINNNEYTKNQQLNLQKQSALLSQTKLQDRELRNVLYETIKHIKATKVVQEEQMISQDILLQNQISYSQFREFTPDQLLALLSVKPEVLQQFLTVFDLKDKAMNLMILKAKFIFNKKNQNIIKSESLQQDI